MTASAPSERAEDIAASLAIADQDVRALLNSRTSGFRARMDLATKLLDGAQKQNARRKEIAAALHWMARRYADGRQSYATSLHNENTRELLAMGVN